MGKIYLIGSKSCKYCVKCKQLFEDRKIPYLFLRVDLDTGLRNLSTDLSGSNSIPQIFINERHLGGYESIVKEIGKIEKEMKNDEEDDGEENFHPKIEEYLKKKREYMDKNEVTVHGKIYLFGRSYMCERTKNIEEVLRMNDIKYVLIRMDDFSTIPLVEDFCSKMLSKHTKEKRKLPLPHLYFNRDLIGSFEDFEKMFHRDEESTINHEKLKKMSREVFEQECHNNDIEDFLQILNSTPPKDPLKPFFEVIQHVYQKFPSYRTESSLTKKKTNVIRGNDLFSFILHEFSSFDIDDEEEEEGEEEEESQKIIHPLLRNEETRETRIHQLCQLMVTRNILYSLDLHPQFVNSKKHLYRFHLHRYRSKNVLNLVTIDLLEKNPKECFIDPNESSSNKSLVSRNQLILRNFEYQLTQIYENFVDGKKVSYDEIQSSEIFKKFVSLTSTFQNLSLESLQPFEKKSLFINLYNALVIHGTIVKGKPSNLLKKYQFFDQVKYYVDGSLFSLNDIEHGILRSNTARPMYFGRKQIRSVKDERVRFICHEKDPRIHFCINCASKSCPPIKIFTHASKSEFESQLDLATSAFIETEVRIETKEKEGKSAKHIISLSKLFKWYEKDFGGSKWEVLGWVSKFIKNDDTKMKILKAASVNNGSKNKNVKYKVKYHSYDWSMND